MPTWKFVCKGCGNAFEKSFANAESRDTWLKDHNIAADCGPVEVVPALTNFRVEGYNARTGYAEKEKKGD